MNKEEYIKYVENNEETSRYLDIQANICSIVHILIDKKICTDKEFLNIKQNYKDKILDESYKKEKTEDLEAVKTIKSFMELFGDSND